MNLLSELCYATSRVLEAIDNNITPECERKTRKGDGSGVFDGGLVYQTKCNFYKELERRANTLRWSQNHGRYVDPVQVESYKEMEKYCLGKQTHNQMKRNIADISMKYNGTREPRSMFDGLID